MDNSIPAQLYFELEEAKKESLKAKRREARALNKINKWKQEQYDREQPKLFKS